MNQHIDARTDEEKALGEEEAVTLGLTILPEGEGVLQMIGLNIPGDPPRILLDLDVLDDGGMRFGLTAGAPFNEADGVDRLVETFELYLELLRNPAVRHAFVEARIQTTPPLFEDDDLPSEPTA